MNAQSLHRVALLMGLVTLVEPIGPALAQATVNSDTVHFRRHIEASSASSVQTSSQSGESPQSRFSSFNFTAEGPINTEHTSVASGASVLNLFVQQDRLTPPIAIGASFTSVSTLSTISVSAMSEVYARAAGIWVIESLKFDIAQSTTALLMSELNPGGAMLSADFDEHVTVYSRLLRHTPTGGEQLGLPIGVDLTNTPLIHWTATSLELLTPGQYTWETYTYLSFDSPTPAVFDTGFSFMTFSHLNTLIVPQPGAGAALLVGVGMILSSRRRRVFGRI